MLDSALVLSARVDDRAGVLRRELREGPIVVAGEAHDLTAPRTRSGPKRRDIDERHRVDGL